MCNRYDYAGEFEEISKEYGARPIGELEKKSRVFPRYLAPRLIRNTNGDRELHPMQFAFSTPGMTTPYHPKKSRNNARIESAHTPPWRDAFKLHRCIVPITAFHEPCYWGPTEKTKVYFHHPEEKRLHAAGIYREWNPPEGGSPLLTMAILIGPAMDYVLEHGHERQPIFITDDGIDSWLDPSELSTGDGKAILREHFANPELSYRMDGPLTEQTWKKNREKKADERTTQAAALARCDYACGF